MQAFNKGTPMYDCAKCPWSRKGCRRAGRTLPRLDWRECPLARDADGANGNRNEKENER